MNSSVVRSTAFLSMRQVAGMALSVVGVLLILRRIGPGSYGLVAVASGILGYLGNLSALGINVFLVRRPGLLREAAIRQAYLMTAGMGTLLAVGVFVGAQPVAQWMGDPRLVGVLRLLALGYWLRQWSLTSLALLERDLRFREVGLIELGGQLTYYAVAIPLVFSGWDYWGVVLGGLAQSAFMAGTTFFCRPVRLRWAWDSGFAKEVLAYGASYQPSYWIWQLRDLVIPILVGRFAGLEAVGILSAAKQFAERITFFRTVFWRVAVSAFARIQRDPQRVREGLAQGMRYQTLFTGPMVALFSSVGVWLMPALLGHRWEMVVKVFPFIACALLVNGIFSLHCAALYAVGCNNDVSVFHAAHVATLWLAGLALVPVLGVWGYGIAEIAALGSYAVIHWRFTATFGRQSYATLRALLPASLVPLFLGPWLNIGAGVLLWAVCCAAIVLLDEQVRSGFVRGRAWLSSRVGGAMKVRAG